MFIKNYIDMLKIKKISDNKNEKDKITDFDDDSSDMK